jgi:nudix-type nucleoside diphosphatase (YffH/AdpP family)
MNAPFPDTNPDVRINHVHVLSDNWYTLNKVDFEYRDRSGRWSTQQREAYDRGNGATVLPIDWNRRTVLLTRQFRVPAYLNGHADGMLIETAAGIIDDDDAAAAIRRESAEETGYHLRTVTPLFELFMSPGSVTERVAFFVAEYTPDDRVDHGGGLESEGEDIEVLELGLDDALERITNGQIVDGKTVLLLQWAHINDHARRHNPQDSKGS